ncbi:MAG: hypothetical protein IKO56_00180, partial [Alphaproteobacteria bacterium]|nr:hypothetical protein [Alphaproteobacteria bacterium]
MHNINSEWTFTIAVIIKMQNIGLKKLQKIKRILNRKEFENLYPNTSPVPYAKSHMTSGGNAPRGSWSEWN